MALFAMPDRNHFQLLCPVVSGLASRGVTAHVFTHRMFAREVERAGGVFVDLFTARPLASADSESRPVPCRHVTYAARYADDVLRELSETRPALVICDTFAVIGRVVACALGIPYVNVSPGHCLDPRVYLAKLGADARTSISRGCFEAVDTLRERYGIEDASPFAYVSGLSASLNLYCEPPEFLTAEERRVFEPVAFFGSLPANGELGSACRSGPYFEDARDALNVYISLGTIVWRYWTDEALEALAAIARAVATWRGAQGLITLGGAELSDKQMRAVRQPTVTVERYADSWKALESASVFITHQGINSTHEAIFNWVPMMSYPIFWDQPALAARCESLGLSIPLAESPRGPLAEEDVHAALDILLERREEMSNALERARDWELATLSGREGVIDQIVELAGS